MSNLKVVRDNGMLIAEGDHGFTFHLAECDCGGPQYGTGHAPDCAFELSGNDAEEFYQQHLWEVETGGGELPPEPGPLDDTPFGPDAHLEAAYEERFEIEDLSYDFASID